MKAKMSANEQPVKEVENLLNHLCILAMMWRSKIKNHPSIQAEYFDTYRKLRTLGWNDAIDWDCELPEENMPKEYIEMFPHLPSSWHSNEAMEEVLQKSSLKKNILQKLKDWLK